MLRSVLLKIGAWRGPASARMSTALDTRPDLTVERDKGLGRTADQLRQKETRKLRQQRHIDTKQNPLLDKVQDLTDH